MPRDLDGLDWFHRYLEEMRPGYVLVLPRSGWGFLAESPRLAPIQTRSPYVLYRVVHAAPESRPWRAPAPIGVVSEVRTDR